LGGNEGEEQEEGISGWEKEHRRFFEERGIEREERENMRADNEERWVRIIRWIFKTRGKSDRVCVRVRKWEVLYRKHKVQKPNLT